LAFEKGVLAFENRILAFEKGVLAFENGDLTNRQENKQTVKQTDRQDYATLKNIAVFQQGCTPLSNPPINPLATHVHNKVRQKKYVGFRFLLIKT
jgi:hypothetical protein